MLLIEKEPQRLYKRNSQSYKERRYHTEIRYFFTNRTPLLFDLMKKTAIASLALLAMGVANSHAVLLWTLGNSEVAGRQAPEISEYYGAPGNVTFWQENNSAGDVIPGTPNSGTGNQNQDDDFYFEGVYNNQVDGGAPYATVGVVATREANLERAITNGDLNNRFHFNFSAKITSSVPTTSRIGSSAVATSPAL